jgi:hypothetical protein
MIRTTSQETTRKYAATPRGMLQADVCAVRAKEAAAGARQLLQNRLSKKSKSGQRPKPHLTKGAADHIAAFDRTMAHPTGSTDNCIPGKMRPISISHNSYLKCIY